MRIKIADPIRNESIVVDTDFDRQFSMFGYDQIDPYGFLHMVFASMTLSRFKQWLSRRMLDEGNWDRLPEEIRTTGLVITDDKLEFEVLE